MSRDLFVFLAFSLLISVKFCQGLDSDEDEDFEEELELHGHPINVLNFTEKNEFIVNIDGINTIFKDDHIKDRKVVAVSIVGIFRKGKSFLLNYFLRYLYGNFKSTNFPENPLNNTSNWIGHPKDLLSGFSWRAGSDRETSGVIMWSDIFLHDTPQGEKLAIILIDTQGLFDPKTSPTVNSKMFALATLISSVQIYNLHNVIQEDQLQYLQFTSDFAKLINNIELDNDEGLDDSSIEKPFQSIVLLMRDWVNAAKYPYGLKGGEKYLNEVLKIEENQGNDQKEVRKFIRSSYEHVNCFLLPHPGNKIFNAEDFDGEWSKLDVNFVKELKNLLSWLFHPSNLIPKKIFNEFVTVEDYVEHLKFYFEAASSNTLMNVSTLFEATMDSEGSIILDKSLRFYKQELKNRENFDNDNFLQELDEISKLSQVPATKKFNKLMEDFGASDDFVRKWTEKFKDQILSEFKEWKSEVTANYEKFQSAKKKAKEQTAMQLENLKKDFESKLKELTQKNENDKKKLEEKLNSTKNQFEIEKIKIQQYREAERQRIVKEKMNDLEKAKKECERIITNSKSDYQNELNELKKREDSLKKQKETLENEQKEQEKILKRKLEEESKNHEMEVARLKNNAEQLRKEFERKAAAEEKKMKAEIARRERMARLELEEFKLKQKLKDFEFQAELNRVRNG